MNGLLCRTILLSPPHAEGACALTLGLLGDHAGDAIREFEKIRNLILPPADVELTIGLFRPASCEREQEPFLIEKAALPHCG